MKLLFIISIMYFNLSLYAQETIDIDFNEAKPKWVHTMIDTTFIPVNGQIYFTKYTSLSPHTISRHENDLYIMATCSEKQTLDDYGFVLDKLDINTGRKIWSHYNTPYNLGQKDIYHNLFIKNDQIEMVGVVDEGESKYFSSYKVLNSKTGQLIKLLKNENLLPGFFTRYYYGHILYSDSVFLNTYTINENSGNAQNPNFNYGLNIEVFDKNLNQINFQKNLFDFDSLGPFSFDQANLTLRLNHNTFVSLAYKDRYKSWDNLGTKMLWADVSDPLNISILQIKDYTALLPGTKESFALLRYKTLNNTIFLSFNYPNFELQKKICYILWTDSLGNIKTYIPIPKTGNHYYQFSDMIYANDHFAYLFSYPSKTQNQGFDIIKIQEGVDSVQFISSLTTTKRDEEFGTQINAVYDDGYLIFGGYTKKTGYATKTSVKYYCFKAEDLGIIIDPVNTYDFIENNFDFIIFPNPATKEIGIKVSNDKKYKLEIYNVTGQLALEKFIDGKVTQIDISNLEQGMYFATLIDEIGIIRSKVEKFVKLN